MIVVVFIEPGGDLIGNSWEKILHLYVDPDKINKSTEIEVIKVIELEESTSEEGKGRIKNVRYLLKLIRAGIRSAC